MRLLWATDLHLEFTDDFLFQRFLSLLDSTPCDVIVLTGDISSGRSLKQHLLRLAAAVQNTPIYVVLGNPWDLLPFLLTIRQMSFSTWKAIRWFLADWNTCLASVHGRGSRPRNFYSVKA